MYGLDADSEEFTDRIVALYAQRHFAEARALLRRAMTQFPTDPDYPSLLGDIHLAEGGYGQARQAFAAALTLRPRHPEARSGMAEALLFLGDDTRGLELARELLEDGSADEAILADLGRACVDTGHVVDGIRLLRAAVATPPAESSTLLALGAALYQADADEEAIEVLTQAADRDRTAADARIHLGHIHYDRGDWMEALAWFRTTTPSDHDDVEGVTRVVALLRQHGGRNTHAEVRRWHARLVALQAQDPLETLLRDVMPREDETVRARAMTPPGDDSPDTSGMSPAAGQVTGRTVSHHTGAPAFASGWLTRLRALLAPRRRR